MNPWDQSIAVFQVTFRQDESQCRRSISHCFRCFPPVFRLGSILVTGFAGPGFMPDSGGGKQDFGWSDSDTVKRHQDHSSLLLDRGKSKGVPFLCYHEEGRETRKRVIFSIPDVQANISTGWTAAGRYPMSRNNAASLACVATLQEIYTTRDGPASATA